LCCSGEVNLMLLLHTSLFSSLAAPELARLQNCYAAPHYEVLPSDCYWHVHPGHP
jgi:hypothetical protein